MRQRSHTSGQFFAAAHRDARVAGLSRAVPNGSRIEVERGHHGGNDNARLTDGQGRASTPLAGPLDPIAAFRARAEPRALLCILREIGLHSAIDELQASAVACDLVAAKLPAAFYHVRGRP
jgi:hypothetical protein